MDSIQSRILRYWEVGCRLYVKSSQNLVKSFSWPIPWYTQQIKKHFDEKSELEFGTAVCIGPIFANGD